MSDEIETYRKFSLRFRSAISIASGRTLMNFYSLTRSILPKVECKRFWRFTIDELWWDEYQSIRNVLGSSMDLVQNRFKFPLVLVQTTRFRFFIDASTHWSFHSIRAFAAWNTEFDPTLRAIQNEESHKNNGFSIIRIFILVHRIFSIHNYEQLYMGFGMLNDRKSVMLFSETDLYLNFTV